MAHSVTLSWTASVDPVAGYNIYRGTNPPGNEGATPINTSLITGLTYVDTNVTAGEKLDYVATAVSASGVESVHSNEITATVPLFPPTGSVEPNWPPAGAAAGTNTPDGSVIWTVVGGRGCLSG